MSFRKCKRCGFCCVVYIRGHWEQCKYLRLLVYKGHYRTVCRIYKNRIGVQVGKNQYCGYRKDTNVDYPNCPFNSGRPIHPAYLNIKN